MLGFAYRGLRFQHDKRGNQRRWRTGLALYYLCRCDGSGLFSDPRPRRFVWTSWCADGVERTERADAADSAKRI